MKKLIGIALAILCIFLLVNYANAVEGRPDKTQPIKCYQCNSFYDKGCSDFFDNKTYPLIPCPSNATMCRKIIQETFYERTWDVRYIRQCGVFGEVGPAEGRMCFERRSTYGVRLKVCHCDNMDGCNIAASLVQNYSHLTVFVLVSLIWLLFCSRLT